MSDPKEPGEDRAATGARPPPSDEFEFYFQFTKPLVLDLPTPEDKAVAAAWVQKLEAEPESEDEKRLRLDYLKLFLFVLQRGRLSGIFKKQPPSGPLQPFPQGFSLSDMGNLMIDEEELPGGGGGDARFVPYTIEISNDLREFVAAQEIPNFGVQMYYAWSSDEPVHKWSLFDEEKFPLYVLEKIKQLKESKSEEKAGEKVCGAKKKPCEVPLIEKYSQNKVKSPQEIERTQGRSYHAYLGLVGRMGSGFKDNCDDDPNRQDPRRNKCPRKGRQCGGNRDGEDMPPDEYENFGGPGGGYNACQMQSCNCPQPHQNAACDSQIRDGRAQSFEEAACVRSRSLNARDDGNNPACPTTAMSRSPPRRMQETFPQAAFTAPLSSIQRRSPSPPGRHSPYGQTGVCCCSSPPCTCPCPRSPNAGSRTLAPKSAFSAGKPCSAPGGFGGGGGGGGGAYTPDVVHCYDPQDLDPSFTKTLEPADQWSPGEYACIRPGNVNRTLIADENEPVALPDASLTYRRPGPVNTGTGSSSSQYATPPEQLPCTQFTTVLPTRQPCPGTIGLYGLAGQPCPAPCNSQPKQSGSPPPPCPALTAAKGGVNITRSKTRPAKFSSLPPCRPRPTRPAKGYPKGFPCSETLPIFDDDDNATLGGEDSPISQVLVSSFTTGRNPRQVNTCQPPQPAPPPVPPRTFAVQGNQGCLSNMSGLLQEMKQRTGGFAEKNPPVSPNDPNYCQKTPSPGPQPQPCPESKSSRMVCVNVGPGNPADNTRNSLMGNQADCYETISDSDDWIYNQTTLTDYDMNPPAPPSSPNVRHFTLPENYQLNLPCGEGPTTTRFSPRDNYPCPGEDDDNDNSETEDDAPRGIGSSTDWCGTRPRPTAQFYDSFALDTPPPNRSTQVWHTLPDVGSPPPQPAPVTSTAKRGRSIPALQCDLSPIYAPGASATATTATVDDDDDSFPYAEIPPLPPPPPVRVQRPRVPPPPPPLPRRNECPPAQTVRTRPSTSAVQANYSPTYPNECTYEEIQQRPLPMRSLPKPNHPLPPSSPPPRGGPPIDCGPRQPRRKVGQPLCSTLKHNVSIPLMQHDISSIYLDESVSYEDSPEFSAGFIPQAPGPSASRPVSQCPSTKPGRKQPPQCAPPKSSRKHPPGDWQGGCPR